MHTTKGNGLKDLSMDKEHSMIKMDLNMLAISCTEKSQVMENRFILMGHNTKENLKITNRMG